MGYLRLYVKRKFLAIFYEKTTYFVVYLRLPINAKFRFIAYLAIHRSTNRALTFFKTKFN